MAREEEPLSLSCVMLLLFLLWLFLVVVSLPLAALARCIRFCFAHLFHLLFAVHDWVSSFVQLDVATLELALELDNRKAG